MLPSKPLGEDLFLPLPKAHSPRCSLVCSSLRLHMAAFPLCLYMMFSSLCLSVPKFPSSYKDTSHVKLILSLHLQRLYFQLSVHLQVLGVSISTYFFEEHDSINNRPIPHPVQRRVHTRVSQAHGRTGQTLLPNKLTEHQVESQPKQRR